MRKIFFRNILANALLLGCLMPSHAFKVTDDIPQVLYPIEEMGAVSGFEWIDKTRLIAVRGKEVAIFDSVQRQWKTVLPAQDVLSATLACISLDRQEVQINVRVSRNATRSERRQIRVDFSRGIALSALETPSPEESNCGGNRVGDRNRIVGNGWFGAVPEDRAIYPLGRKQDGYFDFGKAPLEQGFNYGRWVKADGSSVESKASDSDLRRRFRHEHYDRFMPYLNGYQLNDRCETDQYPTRPPLFFFVRSGAQEVEAVPMPLDGMRRIGFCRQAIALKEGYFIDASGYPAPSNGFAFGLFHILNGTAYLIRGTMNRYLVDAKRVSPDGCKVAYEVVYHSYPELQLQDTHIVDLCSPS